MPRIRKWTPDFVEPGIVICKDPDENGLGAPGTSSGYFSKWLYKVGWLMELPSKSNFVLISLADGMTTSAMTAGQVAEWLNQNKMIPCKESWFRVACSKMKATLAFAPEVDSNVSWKENHPIYPIDAWKEEVWSCNTRLGYEEWVEHQVEANFHNLHVGCLVEVYPKPDDVFNSSFIGRIEGEIRTAEDPIRVGYSNQEDGDVAWDVDVDQIIKIDEAS